MKSDFMFLADDVDEQRNIARKLLKLSKELYYSKDDKSNKDIAMRILKLASQLTDNSEKTSKLGVLAIKGLC
jgi:hypothetical protein